MSLSRTRVCVPLQMRLKLLWWCVTLGVLGLRVLGKLMWWLGKNSLRWRDKTQIVVVHARGQRLVVEVVVHARGQRLVVHGLRGEVRVARRVHEALVFTSAQIECALPAGGSDRPLGALPPRRLLLPPARLRRLRNRRRVVQLRHAAHEERPVVLRGGGVIRVAHL